MSILNNRHNFILDLYIKREKYKKAYNYIQKLHPEIRDDRVNVIYIFLLSELNHFTEANDNIQTLKNVLPNFLPRIYKNMNLINNLKSIAKSNKELYEAHIINGDVNTASKYALKMIKDNINYLLFTTLSTSIKCSDGVELKAIIDKIRGEEKMHSGVLTMIVQKELIGKEMVQFIDTADSYDGDFFIFLKEMLFRGFLTPEIMVSILKKIGNTDIKNTSNDEIPHIFTNYLLSLVDDWKIYLYAIRNGINIEESKSVNYLHYLVKTKKDSSSIVRLIMRLTSFPEIIDILKNTNLDLNPSDETYLLLINFLNNKYFATSREIKIALELYRVKKSLIRFKLLIALLLSTKKEKYILLAFKLAKDAQNEPLYEFRLIYMFIARFFCHCDEFCRAYNEFDVKNVLIPKMYGVWYRLYSSIKNKSTFSTSNHEKFRLFQLPIDFFDYFNDQHFRFKYSTIKSINNTVIYFIEAGLHHHAIELLKLRDKLCDDNYTEKECFNYFENFLGKECKYIFKDKGENNNFDDFIMPNIYSIETKKDMSMDIFRNDVEDIVCPIFQKFILDLYKIYK